ncbi:MAG: hypothetical protein LBB89_08865 [Treponema sp.]|jgi:hypothetical protein|nr:hypothetical protein [Treponema sp.]
MKHTFLTIICVGFLLFGHIGLLGALDFELSGGMNNMTFHPDRVTAHGVSTNYKKFQNYPYGFGDFHVRGEVSDKMDFDVHLSRDNILQNTLSGKIKTTSDYFNIEFGPFAGMIDDFSSPEAGIMGSIQFAYPGIAFLSIGGSSSMGGNFSFLSGNTRQTYEVKAGVWLPGIIPSISINSKSYSKHLEDTTVIRDELTRIQISADFFVKNAPVILTVDIGMETLTRSYASDFSSETKDELTATFAGVTAKWQVTKPIRLIASFEIPVTYSATAPMTDPDDRFKLYKFSAGLAYTVFN